MVFSLRFRRGKVVEDPFVPNEIGDEKKLVRYQSHIQSPTLDDRVRLVLLTGLSLYARIVQLGYPAYITEIELEMSKQVNWYMAGKYFIGKFPPLSSLINTCLALFVGYYGNHDFVYAGQHFSNFPLVGMRKVSAIFGALIAPVCYMTIRNFGHSRSAATFAAILLVFENGIITQSRYASPEIHSMFFGVLATWSWSMARKNTSGSISNGLYWQVITGLCIGLSTSAKWTGALLLPIIWCSIAFEMWNQLSDKKNSVYSCIKKVYVYLFTVGAFPFWIYMLIFKIHFDIASNAGDHDLILSSRFRYSLNGNHFEPSQPSIAYGSQVVIKHEGSPGGFLHSHQKRFTGGSTQQEVTLYPYVDLNNIWTIHKATELYNTSQPLEYVRNGDHIRLEHFPSSRKLHSHDERPQLTNKKEHHEVTAYGDRLTSDIQDYWSLVLLDDKHEHSKDMNVTWKALDQQFRLFHIRGCALISHDAYYDSPGGHGHQEVTCMVSAGKHVSTWTIESAYHEKLENTGLRSFPKMKFYEKFKEAHQLMLKYPTVVFDRLGSQTTSTDGTINPKVTFVETPSKWFFKKTSLRIWYEFSGFSVHLLLNSAVQQIIWSAMLGYMGIRFLKMFLEKRQINLPGLSWINMAATDLMTNDTISFFYPATLIYIQGLHFIPTHTVNMSDILPSIYYGIALSSVIFESLTSRLSLRYRRMVSYSLISIVIFHTLQFSHLSYGGKQWLRSSCEKSGIEMNCIHFPLSQNELDEMINNSGQTPNVTSLTIYLDIFGKKEPFRYQQGQEAEADRELSLLKHSAYSKASALITGTSRYHRANPTPAITIEEAVEWAKKVHEGAVDREKKLSKERAKKKALKKRRKKNALKKRKRLTDKEAEQSK